MNKCDIAEPSTPNLKDVRTLASRKGIPVLATSVKTQMNEQLAFDQLGRMVVDASLKTKYKGA